MSSLIGLFANFSAAVEPSYTLNEKGLIVVGIGLAGVFLILLLFFATIIVIQKMVGVFDKSGKNKETISE
jgi:hypothetical protein